MGQFECVGRPTTFCEKSVKCLKPTEKTQNSGKLSQSTLQLWAETV